MDRPHGGPAAPARQGGTPVTADRKRPFSLLRLGHDLDETFYHTRREADMSVRWVYLHVIEEYARHNGHADLLRERIDGATGE
jgi:hypothetical protein